MSSRSVSTLASQAPRLRVAPRAGRTFGDIAGQFAADYGLAPDPWQQMVLDDWLAETNGRWSSLTCGLSVPRQNGKNALLEVRELFGTVGRGERILHTAHEVKTARKAFKRLQHFFGTQPNDPAAKYPELNALVREVRNVNGQEAVVLTNGGSVEIVARSKNSARGFTVDVLVMDEAQELSEEDLEALMPTTSAAPLGNPQWLFTGTPPGPLANGEVFTRVRAEALREKPRRLCWHEWSISPGADLDDMAEVRAANPALGSRLQMDVVEGERARFSDEGFARERGGRWSEASTGGVLPGWLACADRDAAPGARLVLAVDAAPGLASAAIVACGEDVLEVVDARPGASWVPARVAELQRAHRPLAVALDPTGPAGSLVPDLEAAGVFLSLPDGRSAAQACGALEAAVSDGRVRHRGQASLNEAVAGAAKRNLGDVWKWSRRNSTVDISPLVAATVALWAWTQKQAVAAPDLVDLSDYL